MKIEQEKNGYFRFRIESKDWEFDNRKSAQEFVDMLKTLPACDRIFDRGIWRVDVKHREKVIGWMMETIVPREWELKPLESIDRIPVFAGMRKAI